MIELVLYSMSVYVLKKSFTCVLSQWKDEKGSIIALSQMDADSLYYYVFMGKYVKKVSCPGASYTRYATAGLLKL